VADERDLLVPVHDRAEVVDDPQIPERLADALQRRGSTAGSWRTGCRDAGCSTALTRWLQAFDFLARHDLAGARAGGEARDEILQLGDFLLLLFVVRFDARPDLSSPDYVVVAPQYDDRPVVDIGDACRHR
jgi:hypothetical protein